MIRYEFIFSKLENELKLLFSKAASFLSIDTDYL